MMIRNVQSVTIAEMASSTPYGATTRTAPRIVVRAGKSGFSQKLRVRVAKGIKTKARAMVLRTLEAKVCMNPSVHFPVVTLARQPPGDHTPTSPIRVLLRR